MFILRQIYISVSEVFLPRLIDLGSYVYFEGLTAGNLPQPCRDDHSHDIVTWYMSWKDKTENIDVLCHGVANVKNSNVNGVPVEFNHHRLLILNTLDGLVHFGGWAFVVGLRLVLDLIRGRWWYAFLLRESAKAAMVRFQIADNLARDYLFHNSDWIYRPIWTYEAEKKGSRIIFYFYSTNCEIFKCSDGYPIQTNSWQAMNWPLYLVWDKYQVDFVRRAIGATANIEVVGPIWFQTSSVEIPELPVNTVAVFDVPPRRSSRYQILGVSEEYYIPEVN